MIYIGIDPGTNTGFAVAKDGELTIVETLKIHQAWLELMAIVQETDDKIKVRIEDPNLRKWFGNEKNHRDKAQGAGSVKRDFSIWVDILDSLGIEFERVAPKDIPNLAAGPFKAITGWSGRTSQHAREAAILVHQRK